MNPSDHMNLGDRLGQSFPHFGTDLVDAQLKGQGGFGATPKGAKLAEITANIGIVDVLVVDEVGLIAVDPPPYQIGEITESEDIVTAIEPQALGNAQPLSGKHLLVDIGEADPIEILFHCSPKKKEARRSGPENDSE